jgi:hypothetical protein
VEGLRKALQKSRWLQENAYIRFECELLAAEVGGYGLLIFFPEPENLQAIRTRTGRLPYGRCARKGGGWFADPRLHWHGRIPIGKGILH